MVVEQYRQLMQKSLNAELYRHSLGTAEAASDLAGHYGSDKGKAYLAGLVHDYGKQFSKQELLEKAGALGLKLDSLTMSESRLLHAPVGAALIAGELKLNDPELCRAVYYHTTGYSRLNLFGKLLYLADFIEAGRRDDGVEDLRKLAYTDLNQALLVAVNKTISSILARGLPLHPRSVGFRNNLLQKVKMH